MFSIELRHSRCRQGLHGSPSHALLRAMGGVYLRPRTGDVSPVSTTGGTRFQRSTAVRSRDCCNRKSCSRSLWFLPRVQHGYVWPLQAARFREYPRFHHRQNFSPGNKSARVVLLVALLTKLRSLRPGRICTCVYEVRSNSCLRHWRNFSFMSPRSKPLTSKPGAASFLLLSPRLARWSAAPFAIHVASRQTASVAKLSVGEQSTGECMGTHFLRCLVVRGYASAAEGIR